VFGLIIFAYPFSKSFAAANQKLNQVYQVVVQPDERKIIIINKLLKIYF
jgi:uncharacterized BrkB/YihY/UPF0761 family membrane protein